MTDARDQTDSLDHAARAVGTMLDSAGDESLEGLEGGGFGRYEGLPPRIALEPDGRSGTLLAPLTYFSTSSASWPVPEGAWLDGASIPQPLWSIVGSPYTGKYRDASIVHDHYCITKDRSWQDTHRMFHDGMRCSGVGKARAAVMYYAVYRFGPRWSDPAIEGVAAEAVLSPIGANAAEELKRDAEAIVRHGLDADEVTTLAETRDAGTGANLEGIEGVALDRARLLVVPGGSGTPEDVAAVAEGATQLPSWVVDHFLSLGIRIIACRGSVTDFESDLRGVVPRGWDKVGRTWDSVPGSYFDGKRRVVIATSDGSGRRVVPDKSSGLHGSDSLVVHESLHGYDYSTGHSSLGVQAFRTARSSDIGGLTPYENQQGQAGLEETFAETGAQFCVAPQRLAGRCPNLSAFWQTMPIFDEGIVAPSTAQTNARQPLGQVTRARDGTLTFDLRALGEGGAIGHAVLTVTPSDARHEQLEEELFPQQDGLEEMRAASATFYG